LIVGAQYADLNGKLGAGRSYIVFGKTDSTAVDLSAIASGTGGFVINFFAEDDIGFSCCFFTVYIGVSYVIFGKTDNTAINLSTMDTGGFVINSKNANI
jgi:hypothetical protein